MKRLCVLAFVLVFAVPSMAQAAPFYATLLNDTPPWIVMDAGGTVYELAFLGGTMLFWKGDVVLLTKRWGFAHMVGARGLSKGKVARVWITEK